MLCQFYSMESSRTRAARRGPKHRRNQSKTASHIWLVNIPQLNHGIDWLWYNHRRWERVWQWDPSSPRYVVKFDVNQWVVRILSRRSCFELWSLIPLIQAAELSTGKIHALMTPYIPRILKISTAASVTFSEGVREFDKWVLLLVLLRMETRRIDSNRRLRANFEQTFSPTVTRS